MTEALNHSRIWSLISKATRNALPDLSAVAEREMEKLISSEMRNTLDRGNRHLCRFGNVLNID